MVESSVLQVPTSFSAVRSSAASLTERSLSSRLVDSMVRTMSLSHRAMVRTMVNCVTRSPEVGGAEDGVHGGHVVVLVHGDGPRGERGAGQAELLVREALEPPVRLELMTHGLEPARRAGVPRDGGADLRVEARDLRGDGLGLVAVLLERRRPRPGRSGRQRHGGRERAEREERGQRQATYRMALFQCASSEACGSVPPA